MPQRRSNSKKYGDLGEEYALRLLQKNGYKVIDRNFRTKFGEIDIVAIDPSPRNTRGKLGSGQAKDTLVFVEVKTRWGERFGSPEEAVNPKKVFRIKKAAEIFLWKNQNLPKKLRIDIVGIEMEGNKIKSAKIIKGD